MTQLSSSSIAIVGMGAIGTLLAYHWRELSPFCVSRNQNPCHRQLIITDQHQHTLDLPVWQANQHKQNPLEWLVVTTKASDTLTALKPLESAMASVKRILLLQNGMGQQQQIADWLQTLEKAPELWAGISTEGAYRRGDEQVFYAGHGETVIGRWIEHHNQASSNPVLPGVSEVNDIQQRIQAKLAINAVINPLTAVFRCRNGELVENPAYKQKLEQLAEETQNFFEAHDWQLPFILKQRAAEVAQATAANQSSTLQDILNQRPTELAYINGFLLRQAQQQQDLPLTRQLMQQLGEI